MSIVPEASKKMTFIRLQILSKGLPGSPLPGTHTAAGGSWEPIWHLWYRHLRLQCGGRQTKESLGCPRSAPGFDFPGTSGFSVDFSMHPMATLMTRTSGQSMWAQHGPQLPPSQGLAFTFTWLERRLDSCRGALCYLRAKHQCNILKSSGFSLSKELLFNMIFLNFTENSGAHG